MFDKRQAEEMLKAIKESDTPLGSALAGMQQGLQMGISRSMTFKYKQFLDIRDACKFMNEKDEQLWRCAINVAYSNSFWFVFYYEGNS